MPIPHETTLEAPAQHSLAELEQSLAHAGAEYDIFLHTKKQKTSFEASLASYLGGVEQNTAELIESCADQGANDSQVERVAIDYIMSSKRAVLEEDLSYRLENYRTERLKNRMAGGKISRYAGKVGSVAVSGSVLWLMAKGLEASSSHRHSFGIVLSTLFAQVGLRSLGERTKNFFHIQLDEYKPHEVTKRENGEPKLAKQAGHSEVVEGALYKIAGQHYSDSPGDHGGLAPKLTEGLGSWYEEYYRQPTMKDRAETLMVAVFTSGALAILGASLAFDE